MNEPSLLYRRGLTTGLFTVVVANKLFSREKFLDTRCYFKSPAKTGALFFFGVTFACLVNCFALQSNNAFSQNYHLKRRVEENRRAHNLLDVLRYGLDVRISPMFIETDE